MHAVKYLDQTFFLAQLLQLTLLLARVKQHHKLAAWSQACISAVAQRHHSVQAIKPAIAISPCSIALSMFDA